MHIYPAIDLLGGKCVRLRQGDYTRETVFSDDPVAVARHWVEQGAERLHIVDLDGAKAGKPMHADVIRAIARTVSVPIELGGGIRTEADLAEVLSWGVQWAVLGTKAIRDPEWVAEQARRFPRRIVLGLDARDGLVATDGWLETSEVRATSIARKFQEFPLYAIVYTDIARDGMMSGPNFEALAEMRAATSHRVIASGGICRTDQVLRLHREQTFGCIIGRALYEGTIGLKDLLEAVRRNGSEG